jgi:hypothetical protein
MTYAMIDSYCASYARAPGAVTLDIDDIVDVVRRHRQLALFNGTVTSQAQVSIDSPTNRVL